MIRIHGQKVILRPMRTDKLDLIVDGYRRAAVRLVLLALAVALVAPACGQVDRDPPDAAEGASVTLERSPIKAETPVAGLEPPPVILASEAGRQVGPRGGYCVHSVQTGEGLCVDIRRPEAKQANVVRPGETIAIVLDGAPAVKGEGCTRDASCIGEVQVSPAGCTSATVARIFLERGSETRWRVNLEPGAYELQVFVRFEADDGRSGDTSAALGLLVDSSAVHAIVPMPAAAAVCR